MLNVTRLLTGRPTPSDGLRYGRQETRGVEARHIVVRTPPPRAADRRPVVVWNVTRRCNLHCIHCYANSENREYAGELTTAEALAVVHDLARFRVPAVLVSGGEPLLRPDLLTLLEAAGAAGLRCTLSTNGTLITPEVAASLAAAAVSYVGISVDGIGETHDRFRAHRGAFAKTVAGIRHSRAAGLRVGLRMTLTRQTVADLTRVFAFIEDEGIERACFYHLVGAGRGYGTVALGPAETRQAVQAIFTAARDFSARGVNTELLTVDQAADGAFLYLALRRDDPARAAEALELLRWNGGARHSSGVGIGNIDFYGGVHPDQFWMHYTLGNVRERPFSEIWQESEDPLLAGLRDRLPRLQGRCGRCAWRDVCGGSFRARADLATGDAWAEDPACYLSDAEVAGRVEAHDGG